MMMFKKLKPLRPTVLRKGNTIKMCHYYTGQKQCLGARCFWPKLLSCPIYNRINGNVRKAK